MGLSNLLGFELEEALPLLLAQGLQVQDIITTRPVKKVEKSGKARIVRIDALELGNVRVVVANYNF